MTIYEQIQGAVELVERRIAGTGPRGSGMALSHAEAAREAGMSERSFRTWFQAVTSLSWRSYVVRRRLALAARSLEESDAPIVDIAFEAGYETHEAFTRSFKREFSVPPGAYRQRGGAMDPILPPRLEKIRLYGELYMGVIVKELSRMEAVYFDAFQPNPENKAKAKLDEWRKANPSKARRRVFGHNINGDGSTACTPEYAGYRFYCVIDEDDLTTITRESGSGKDGASKARVTAIEAGTFVVTGIEGNFSDDPSGAWIGAGWERMNAMVKEKGYRVKEGGRWFEEELEPGKPGNLRLDLYLEIEGISRR